MNNVESRATIGPAATVPSKGAERGVSLLQMRGVTRSFFDVPVLGGRRYRKGCDVKRYVSDAKVTQIYDCASGIQKVVIVRHIPTESGAR